MPIRIALLGDLHLLPEAEERLASLTGEHLDRGAASAVTSNTAIKAATDAEVALASPFIDLPAPFFEACSSLRYLGICGTSLARVDLEAADAHGVIVRNVTHYGDGPSAEYVFMKLAMLARGVGKYQWRDQPSELRGKTLGIIGLGALGQSIAHLSLAYGMNTEYYSPHRKPDWEALGVVYASRQHLLESSDVIVIAVPTDTLAITSDDFAAFKSNGILVQLSVGEVFDRAAFERWIARDDNFAIFDAGAEHTSQYAQLPRVLYSPFQAGDTYETAVRLTDGVVNNLEEYLQAAESWVGRSPYLPHN